MKEIEKKIIFFGVSPAANNYLLQIKNTLNFSTKTKVILHLLSNYNGEPLNFDEDLLFNSKNAIFIKMSVSKSTYNKLLIFAGEKRKIGSFLRAIILKKMI